MIYVLWKGFSSFFQWIPNSWTAFEDVPLRLVISAVLAVAGTLITLSAMDEVNRKRFNAAIKVTPDA